MRWMSYKEILPIGSSLIVGSVSFGLGAVWANLPYDYYTLWTSPGEAYEKVFQDSLRHYAQWANASYTIHYLLFFVMGLGFIGSLIKLYKPLEDAKYFEYGSLGLYTLAVVIYLTNLRTGINSIIYDNWGEVPMETGINVMAASQFMIVVLLVGVLVLQGGLYFAEWYDGKLKEEFFAEEAEREKLEASKSEAIEDKAEATGAEVTQTKPAKKTKKASKKA